MRRGVRKDDRLGDRVRQPRSRLWRFPVHSPRLTEGPASSADHPCVLWLKSSHSPVIPVTTLAGLRRSLETWAAGEGCSEVGLLSPEPAEREGALLRGVGWGALGALKPWPA